MRVRSSSITATTFARKRSAPASRAPSTFPDFVPAFIRPLFCRGSGPFRFAALSGDPADIARCDDELLRLFPERRLAAALDYARARAHRVSKACPRASAGSATAIARRRGCAFNELVRSGAVKAPIVIGRDHLDTGSVASPYRETEAHEGRQRCDRRLADPQRAAQHRRGRALGEFPSRRRRRHRLQPARGNGRRRRRHAKTRASACECVLTTDCGLGVVRHADAGYELAIETADAKGIDWRL